jgi:hypothetical protein
MVTNPFVESGKILLAGVEFAYVEAISAVMRSNEREVRNISFFLYDERFFLVGVNEF